MITIDREDTDQLSRSKLGLRFVRQLSDIPEKAPRSQHRSRYDMILSMSPEEDKTQN